MRTHGVCTKYAPVDEFLALQGGLVVALDVANVSLCSLTPADMMLSAHTLWLGKLCEWCGGKSKVTLAWPSSRTSKFSIKKTHAYTYTYIHSRRWHCRGYVHACLQKENTYIRIHIHRYMCVYTHIHVSKLILAWPSLHTCAFDQENIHVHSSSTAMGTSIETQKLFPPTHVKRLTHIQQDFYIHRSR